MTLFLIRHGETDLNATRVVQFPDTPLGTNGILQAERLGQRFAHTPPRLVLTSDYLRARMTAERLAQHAGARLLELPLLRERNFGDLRGKPYESFGGFDVFAEDYEPPGGESWPAFHARVDRAWDELLSHVADAEGDIAVVTHGLVLRSLLQRKLDAAEYEIDADLVVANTSVTMVDPTPPWRVAKLACIAHLNDVAPVGGAA